MAIPRTRLAYCMYQFHFWVQGYKHTQEYPEYYDVISEPIDLKMIGLRVRDKYYSSRELFTRDLLKMLENCRKFNTPSSEVYKCAERIQQYIKYVMFVCVDFIY